jgi:DNA-directed RNA polymerase subunit alpha
MKKVTCVENYTEQNGNKYGCFIIEPLEIGQGITLGNALRRTLISDLSGFAITGARVNNLKHEFSVIEGLREDILEVLLNLKEVVFKSSLYNNQSHLKFVSELNIKGPAVITAGMFNLPKGKIKILNPNQYICTLLDNSDLRIDIDIEKGKGYQLTEESINEKFGDNFSPLNPSTLRIDAIFMPVKKVNYKIKLIHDTLGNIKESLQLEVLTNGSITPKRAIHESLKIIIEMIYPLFNTTDFLNISSQLATNYFN